MTGEPRRGRRRLRHAGSVLLVAGVLLLGYAAAVLFWRDPATDLYARWQQRELARELAQVSERFEEVGYAAAEGREAAAAPEASPEDSPEAEPAEEVVEEDAESGADVLARLARDFGGRIELGDPLGRIVVPRLDLDAVFVHGTRWGPDLSRGPGHYEQTSLPGSGRTMGIAGHRTTFGAPFRHIDDLVEGDEIELELPYGTFGYEVFEHEIVESDDWSVIRERGFDTLMLSACHPLYGSSHRWIVYARLVRAELASGEVVEVAAAPASR